MLINELLLTVITAAMAGEDPDSKPFQGGTTLQSLIAQGKASSGAAPGSCAQAAVAPVPCVPLRSMACMRQTTACLSNGESWRTAHGCMMDGAFCADPVHACANACCACCACAAEPARRMCNNGNRLVHEHHGVSKRSVMNPLSWKQPLDSSSCPSGWEGSDPPRVSCQEVLLVMAHMVEPWDSADGHVPPPLVPSLPVHAPLHAPPH